MATQNSSTDENCTTTENGSVLLDADQVRDIRRALLIGLESFGEVERLSDMHDTMARIGIALPEGSQPRRSAEGGEAVSDFAAAPLYIEV